MKTNPAHALDAAMSVSLLSNRPRRGSSAFMSTRPLIMLPFIVMLLGCGRDATPEPRRKEILLPASLPAGSVDEVAAVDIARRCVSSNDTWAARAVYEAKRKGTGWRVTASRIEGYGTNGEPRFAFGGERFIMVDEHGAVTSYTRGL